MALGHFLFAIPDHNGLWSQSFGTKGPRPTIVRPIDSHAEYDGLSQQALICPIAWDEVNDSSASRRSAPHAQKGGHWEICRVGSS